MRYLKRHFGGLLYDTLLKSPISISWYSLVTQTGKYWINDIVSLCEWVEKFSALLPRVMTFTLLLQDVFTKYHQLWRCCHSENAVRVWLWPQAAEKYLSYLWSNQFHSPTKDMPIPFPLGGYLGCLRSFPGHSTLIFPNNLKLVCSSTENEEKKHQTIIILKQMIVL